MSLRIVCPLPADVALVVLVGPEPQEAGGDQRLGVVRGELVAGELLADEPVVRLVRVERPDDVVAIRARRRAGTSSCDSRRSRRSGPGRASAGPSARRSAGRRAGGRPAARRRPAAWSATNASTSSGVGGRPVRSNVTRRIRVRRSASATGVSPFSSSRARTKRVDRGPASSRTRRPGQALRTSPRTAPPSTAAPERLERPEDAIGPVSPAPGLDPRNRRPAPRPRALARRGPGPGGPGNPQGDPAGQGVDLGRARACPSGASPAPRSSPPRPAGSRPACPARPPARLASLEHRLQRVQPQAALLLRGPVARVAFLGQQRPDLLLEEPRSGRPRRRVRSRLPGRGGRGETDRARARASDHPANPTDRRHRSRLGVLIGRVLGKSPTDR